MNAVYILLEEQTWWKQNCESDKQIMLSIFNVSE